MIGIYFSNIIINDNCVKEKNFFLEFGPGNGILIKIIMHVLNQF